MIRKLFLLAYLFTFAATALAGDPVISEFMASNQNSVVDEDGAHSDWIEIRNPDATPVSLNGWFLTDTVTNKSKWAFPNMTLAGNSYLLVWASGNDRRVVGQPLHTNFNLSSSGEYLALVKPDGATVTTEFAPTFLPQFADISFGTSTTSNNVTLIDKPTPARAFVPADDTLGATWRAAAFNDSSWFSGTFAVGFMNYTSGSNPNLQADLGIDLKALVPAIGGTGRSSYARAHFNLANPALVTKLVLNVNYDDGFHAWINAGNVASSPGAPAEGALVFNSPAGQTHAPGAFETFDISARINTLAAGDNVLALQTLNTNTTSSDLFIWPQLIVSIDSGLPGITGYFTAATPGVANGGPNTIQLPQTVTASRAPGTFTTAFNLTLSGAAAGQEIRYVIADPSGTGAVLAEPTVTSTLYSAPVNIPTSKLIRAAIFNTANGQKSRSNTLQYLLLETGGVNNTSGFTSNVPILIADDHGAGEPVDGAGGGYTTSLFHVHDLVAGTASLNSAPVAFSRAGIRVRGSSSSGFPKRSYGLELRDEVEGDRNVPLLGLASDSDWVLNGPWLFDDTFIHNAFINEVSRQCGRWAPRTKFVEMFVNQNGGKLDYTDYVGIYVLTEKIKSNNNRLNIAQLDAGDNSGDAVTGGYIFKVDRNDPDEVVWTTPGGVGLVLVEPDPQVDTPQQISYIQSYTQTFDTTLTNERNANFATRNYRNYMDSAAWVDHHILNSIAYNVDALRLSAYFFKDRGKRINAGPIWDFDRALGSDDGRDFTPNSWANIEYFFTLGWWGHVFRDPDFVQAWVDRWVQLRAGPLATANLNGLADAQGAQIGNATGARDAARWPDNAANGVYLSEIAAMKTWLTTRAAWIDGQMPAAPTASVATGNVGAGSTVTLSGAGTIRYTINGADPRPAGGGTPGTGTIYSGAITLSQTTVITARRQLPVTTTVFAGQGAIGINWSGPLTRVYLVNEFFATLGDIAVSEIHFNPLGPTPSESLAVPGVTADEFEFVEIRNIGARKVNTFEVRFPDTRPFKELKLAPFTMNPGDRAFVVKNRAAFEARYGTAQSLKIVGEWTEGSLDDNGETIELRARDNTLIQTFLYDDDGTWPGRADGRGSSLEYLGLTFADVDFNNGLNWRSSSEFHGSPGIAGAGPDNSVTINEVLNNTALPYVDAVELINNTAAPVNIGGWFLSNRRAPESGDDYKQFRIPNGTTIPVGGFLVFNETDFNPNGAWNPSPGVPGAGEFSFDGNHDNEAWLLQADAGGKLLKFVDHADVGAARLNESWGRRPDGTGALYPMLARTCYDEASVTTPKAKLGAPNSAPRTGPLILSEVHHSPVGGNTDLEFIELRNPTASAQSLALWRLRGDADFDFTTESIPAGGLLVIVPFAPTDAVKAAAFRTAYSISIAVPLAGPWQIPDHLGLPGNVTLYRAGDPPALEPGYHPLTIEDQTAYASGGVWPATTTGLSLNRRGSTSFGIDAANWRGDIPSPGTTGPSYTQWKAFYFPGGGPGSLDGDDPDGDSSSNAREYGLGGNPLTFESQQFLLPSITTQPGVGGATDYIFTFKKPLNRPGTTHAVETTTDFITWTAVPDTIVSATPDSETRRAIITVPAGTPRRFFHLRIDIAP